MGMKTGVKKKVVKTKAKKKKMEEKNLDNPLLKNLSKHLAASPKSVTLNVLKQLFGTPQGLPSPICVLDKVQVSGPQRYKLADIICNLGKTRETLVIVPSAEKHQVLMWMMGTELFANYKPGISGPPPVTILSYDDLAIINRMNFPDKFGLCFLWKSQEGKDYIDIIQRLSENFILME